VLVKLNIFRITIIIYSLFFVASFGNAWGILGHQLVACIAKRYLTPTTSKEVNSILSQSEALNHAILSTSNYKLEETIIKTDELENIMIASAMWADKTAYMTWKGDRDRIRTLYYMPMHYISPNTYILSNMSIDSTKGKETELIDTCLAIKPVANVIDSLDKSIKTLKSTKNSIMKTFALMYIIHMMGDIGCPAHTGDPYYLPTRSNLQGGNLVKIEPAFDMDFWNPDSGSKKRYNKSISSLHSFWDQLCGAYDIIPGKHMLNVTSLLAKNLNAISTRIIETYNNETWNKDTDTLIVDDADYEKPMNLSVLWGIDNLKIFNDYVVTSEFFLKAEVVKEKSVIIVVRKDDLPDDYVSEGQRISNKMIYVSGRRLAHLLNAIFDPKYQKNKNIEYVTYVSSVVSDPDILPFDESHHAPPALDL
jgi:hypothetical protein